MNCEKTSALCPSSTISTRRGTRASSFALGPPVRAGRRGPGGRRPAAAAAAPRARASSSARGPGARRGRGAPRGSGRAARRTGPSARRSSSQHSVCSVFGGQVRRHLPLVRRRMNGREPPCEERHVPPRRASAPPRARGTRPSRPGFRNSKRLHSSPRWFSTGVPERARRWSAPQEPRRLRRLGARVLDRLRLVEDHVVEGDVLQERRVAPQRAVGGEDQVAAVECPRLPRAVEAGVIAHPQPRGEAGRLLLPVEDERAGNDDERGLLRLTAGAPRGAPGPARSCPGPCRRPGTPRSRSRGGRPSSRGRAPGSRAGGR